MSKEKSPQIDAIDTLLDTRTPTRLSHLPNSNDNKKKKY